MNSKKFIENVWDAFGYSLREEDTPTIVINNPETVVIQSPKETDAEIDKPLPEEELGDGPVPVNIPEKEEESGATSEPEEAEIYEDEEEPEFGREFGDEEVEYEEPEINSEPIPVNTPEMPEEEMSMNEESPEMPEEEQLEPPGPIPVNIPEDEGESLPPFQGNEPIPPQEINSGEQLPQQDASMGSAPQMPPVPPQPIPVNVPEQPMAMPSPPPPQENMIPPEQPPVDPNAQLPPIPANIPEAPPPPPMDPNMPPPPMDSNAPPMGPPGIPPQPGGMMPPGMLPPPIVPPTDIGKIELLKSIQTKLLDINSLLNKFSEERYGKVKSKVEEAIEVFNVMVTNFPTFKDKVLDIAEKYKHFIKIVVLEVRKIRTQEKIEEESKKIRAQKPKESK